MTRYFQILIEKESIPIDLSLKEINKVPHYTLSATEYDKFVVRIDYDLVPYGTDSPDSIKWLAGKIINRHYKRVISITEIYPKEHFNPKEIV